MSNVQNARLRCKRSLSISSLSSGSLNDAYTNIPRKSKDESLKTSHYKDRYHSRNRDGSIYSKDYNKSNYKYERNRCDKKVIPDHTRDKDIKTIVEDSQRDPSTCDFQGIFYHTNIDSTRQDDSKVEEMDNYITEATDNRLERLEKLVEMLINNSKTSSNVQQDDFTSEKDPFELIPRNFLFTTSMWLNKIDEECMKRDFDEKTSIKFIQSKMTGSMKAWFKTLTPYEFTWPELKILITETFPDNIDFATTLKLLIARSMEPTETIQNYYYSKMYLLEACKISGKNAVSCLLDGLQSELKEQGKCYNFLTPEALYSQFLSKLPEVDNSLTNHLKSEEQTTSVYEETTFVDSYEHVKMQPDGRHSFRSKSKKCFTCKKFGHIAADCRHAPICYNCKRTGHIALNCMINH